MGIDQRKLAPIEFGLMSQRIKPTVKPPAQRHNKVELTFIENGAATYLFGIRSANFTQHLKRPAGNHQNSIVRCLKRGDYDSRNTGISSILASASRVGT